MKKFIKVPFNLKKAKAGAKVVTRNDLPARIICYDRIGEYSVIERYPIIGLVLSEDGNELLHSFTANGEEHDSSFDLFLLEEIEEEEPKFEPFQRVLVRDNNNQVWRPSLFLYYNNDDCQFRFAVAGNAYKQCIPYEGNEHLNGTNKKPE